MLDVIYSSTAPFAHIATTCCALKCMRLDRAAPDIAAIFVHNKVLGGRINSEVSRVLYSKWEKCVRVWFFSCIFLTDICIHRSAAARVYRTLAIIISITHSNCWAVIILLSSFLYFFMRETRHEI